MVVVKLRYNRKVLDYEQLLLDKKFDGGTLKDSFKRVLAWFKKKLRH